LRELIYLGKDYFNGFEGEIPSKNKKFSKSDMEEDREFGE
jgi:hypothetical protein